VEIAAWASCKHRLVPRQYGVILSITQLGELDVVRTLLSHPDYDLALRLQNIRHLFKMHGIKLDPDCKIEKEEEERAEGKKEKLRTQVEV